MARTHSNSTTLLGGKKAIFLRFGGVGKGSGRSSARRGRGQGSAVPLPKKGGNAGNGGNLLKFKPTPPKPASGTPNRLFWDPKSGFLYLDSAQGAPSFVFEVEIHKCGGLG